MKAVASVGDKRSGAAPGVVAMASSAGGFNALMVVLAGLDEDFPAAVVVVQHLDPHYVSRMPELLARRTRMTVTHAMHGTRLHAGQPLRQLSGCSTRIVSTPSTPYTPNRQKSMHSMQFVQRL